MARLMFRNIVFFMVGFSSGLVIFNTVYRYKTCVQLDMGDDMFKTKTVTPASSRVRRAESLSINTPSQNKTEPELDAIKVWLPSSNWLYSDARLRQHASSHYNKVFRRLGPVTFVKSFDDNWDLSHSAYSAYHRHKDKVLAKTPKPFQKFNFIPGMTLLTSKDILIAKGIPSVPKSFVLPQERETYNEYVKKYPDKQWIYKERSHLGKGVRFPTLSDLKYPKQFSMLQEFIADPFIVDKRKMELGVYTTVMSVDPLRVYINNGDWYPRFCGEDYYPFDIGRTAKYVMQHASRNLTWEMPSLKYGHDVLKLSNKANVFSYLRSKGFDSEKMEATMKDIIRNVYTTMEEDVIEDWKHSWNSFGRLYKNFFELHRFDFALDSLLNVYLLEVNLNPGLGPTHPIRRQQSQRLVYGVLSLAGMVSNPRKQLSRSNKDEKEMRVYYKDFSTFSDSYWSLNCSSDCGRKECRFSVPCLSEDEVVMLENAVHEHFHRLDWVRIVPEPFKSQEAARSWDRHKDPHFLELTPRSRWMAEWFWGKCLTDQAWCR